MTSRRGPGRGLGRGLGAIAAVVVLAGCGQSTGSGSSAPSADDVDEQLLGRQFATQGVAGTTARLSFETDAITANAGCNTLSGRARTDSGRLFVDSLGGTEMGCPPALSKQDTWWAELLGSDPTYTLTGPTLQLVSRNETVELVDVEETHPDRTLLGTRWVLETVARGGQAGVASSMPGRSAGAAYLKLVSGVNTEVTGNTGCGRLRAPVAVTESSLRLGSVLSTQGCADDDLQWVSQQVHRVLDGRVDFAIDGDVLTLTKNDRSLVYRAAARG